MGIDTAEAESGVRSPASSCLATLLRQVRPKSWVLVTCLPALLTGCGTVFDPSPYNPRRDPSVLRAADPPYTASKVLAFDDAGDAIGKLQALSDGYAEQRDALMRGQLIFDIPMIGLGAAAIINPLFNGAKNTTLALGLGAAAAGGGRLYFGPQTKVAAYNTASLALSCAASAAIRIAAETNADSAAGQSLDDRLREGISDATSLKSGDPTLQLARDQAVKSRDALEAALATLRGAPGALQDFAYATIRDATNKVVSNVQNVETSLKLLSDAATLKPAPAAASASLAGAPQKNKVDPVKLARDLQTNAAAADAITQRINAAMGALPKCSTSS